MNLKEMEVVLKIRTAFLIVVIAILMSAINVFASDAKTSLTEANKFVIKSIELAKDNNIDKAKSNFDLYKKSWLEAEDSVKAQSKKAYADVEEKMGMAEFLFSQKPIQNDKILEALQQLSDVNENFIQGKYQDALTPKSNKSLQVKDLVLLLDSAKGKIKSGDNAGALKDMNTFKASWIDIEGVILTKSQVIYHNAEKDMVASRAYLSMNPVQSDKALKVIERMKGYLSSIDSNTSYTMIDVITIILREGLEALLVVIALLGFIKKSGQEDKKIWIYGGVGVGLVLSTVLAVVIKVLFTSGTFGNNNFLISGWTGIFAAVMLIYVSYWLHSKSSAKEWKNYIGNQSTKALATGSLFSLGFLAFLAVFREGTETVLFYIGMASSISLYTLLLGVLIGAGILILIAFLILKFGLKIPMRPFFIVSSILVFYLGFKFTGMGINGLQLAGIMPANTSEALPTISWLAVYPSWQCFIAQLFLIMLALLMITRNYFNNRRIKV